MTTLSFRWNGNAMVPVSNDAKFVPGKVYRLKEDAERSPESHGHYFACISAAFDNLPEAHADRFASPEHLRKWCLIKAGYRNERTYVAPSPREAASLAAFIRPLDEFAVVVVRKNIVHVLTAKTQKLRRSGGDGMNKEEFEASKEAVLRECSKLIGTDAVELVRHEAKAA